MELDKMFLLCYTDLGSDHIRRLGCAWFETEYEILQFVEGKQKNGTFEVDVAIEITEYRSLNGPFTE